MLFSVKLSALPKHVRWSSSWTVETPDGPGRIMVVKGIDKIHRASQSHHTPSRSLWTIFFYIRLVFWQCQMKPGLSSCVKWGSLKHHFSSFKASLTPCGKLGLMPYLDMAAAAERIPCYPLLPVHAVFLHVQTMLVGIFNARTDAEASECTQGLCERCKTVCTDVWL